MADHVKVEATPKQIEEAEKIWDGFMKGGTWAVVLSCIALILLGIVFIDW